MVNEQSEEVRAGVRSGVRSDGPSESGSAPSPTAFVLTGGGNLGAVQVGMM